MKRFIKNNKPAFAKASAGKQSGIALLLTVIILSVVMLIAMLISNIVITQLKLAGDINDSVAAIYAADSGVECQLYNIRQAKLLNCFSGGDLIMSNGATIATTVIESAPSFTIKSLGSYRTVKRQFEVNF